MASPLRDGSFDIAEIVLLTTPTSSIRLSPPQLTRAVSRFSKAKPIASQVQVSAGSQPVLIPDGRINQRTDLPLNASTKRVELRYRLGGITVRSMPSRAGRALTAIRPLVAGAPENLPVAMVVSGASVLNIECPVLRLSERACSIGEAIEPSRQTKAAVEKCRDCRPVRFAEGAMRYGDSAAIVRPTIAMRRGAILADGRDEG